MNRKVFYCAMLAGPDGRRAYTAYKYIEAEHVLRVWKRTNRFWKLLYIVKVTMKPKGKRK